MPPPVRASPPVPTTDPSDPLPLLCESCGYSLRGLDTESMNCSECGAPVADSLPSRRPGSPWQRRPGLSTWFATHAGTLTRPARRFRTLRTDRAGAGMLLGTTLPLAALLSTPVLVEQRFQQPDSTGGLMLAVVFSLLISAVLTGLTWIEHRGIRFFAARRQWRLTPQAAWQICAHASVGWLIGPALLLVARAAGLGDVGGLLNRLPEMLQPPAYLGAGFFLFTRSQLALFLMSCFAGMLAFETLVYVGVRRCRWANPPGIAPAA